MSVVLDDPVSKLKKEADGLEKEGLQNERC